MHLANSSWLSLHFYSNIVSRANSFFPFWNLFSPNPAFDLFIYLFLFLIPYEIVKKKKWKTLDLQLPPHPTFWRPLLWLHRASLLLSKCASSNQTLVGSMLLILLLLLLFLLLLLPILQLSASVCWGPLVFYFSLECNLSGPLYVVGMQSYLSVAAICLFDRLWLINYMSTAWLPADRNWIAICLRDVELPSCLLPSA